MSALGDIRTVARLSPAHRRPLGWAIVAGSAAAACGVALLGTSGWLISRAAQHPHVLALSAAIVAVRAFGIGRAVLRYVERLVSHDAVLRGMGHVRAATYGRLERVGTARLHSAELMSRFAGDIDAVQDWWLRVLLPAAVAGIVGLSTAVVVLVFVPAAGVVLLLGLLGAGLILPWLAARSAQREEAPMAALRGELVTRSADVLGAAAQVIAYNALDDCLDRVRGAERDLVTAQRRAARSSALLATAGVALAGATVVACAALDVRAAGSGALSAVMVATVVLLPLAAFELIAGLPAAGRSAVRVAASASRVRELLTAEPAVVDPVEPAPLPAGSDLRLQGVRLQWAPDAPVVVDDLDLDLPAGRRIALVGPSGSGKSTIAQALARRLAPAAGSITLAGTPVERLAADDVRQVVLLSDQRPYVFDSTVRENLRLARPEASDEELRAVLDRVRLGDWLAGLPAGLDTFVGEHGGRMSGGERMRLALARALLADPQVLVADEPTEHVDEATAGELIRDLVAVSEGRTLVLLTHRTEELSLMDQIVTLPSPETRTGGTR